MCCYLQNIGILHACVYVKKHINAAISNILIKAHNRIACKRRSSVNSGAWLRRFDDVTGVEESCVAKGINRKKAKEKYFDIAN